MTRQLAINLAMLGMVVLLADIHDVAEQCRCDIGYAGGCGCSKSILDMVHDAISTLDPKWWMR